MYRLSRFAFKASVLLIAISTAPAMAQDAFYQGKTVRIIDGASAGERNT